MEARLDSLKVRFVFCAKCCKREGKQRISEINRQERDERTGRELSGVHPKEWCVADNLHGSMLRLRGAIYSLQVRMYTSKSTIRVSLMIFCVTVICFMKVIYFIKLVFLII